jgi:hypothetical protein
MRDVRVEALHPNGIELALVASDAFVDR